MKECPHCERASSVTALVVMLCLGAGPTSAQHASETYEGQRLAEALQALQARGLRIVFSSEIVTSEMRVVAEPRGKVARQLLDELLEPHGLKAEAGPAGVLQVIRARRSKGVDPPRPPAGVSTGAIQGQVIDLVTGSPLPDVLVQVVGTVRETRTDEAGRFQLPDVRAGVQTLSVSKAGSAPLKRTVSIVGGETLAVEIVLPHHPGAYSERVIVTAPRGGRRDPGVGSEVRVGGRELQALRGVLADDPMRTVQVFPRVATGDDFRSEFSVRGSPYRHVGVVIDGVATPWLQHAAYGRGDTGSVAMLNSEVVEQATLQAGAYPRRDGDRLGAQLDLTLREGSRTATRLHGGIGGANATLVGEGPIGRLERGSWLLALRQSYLDWPIGRVDHSATVFGFADAQAKLVYDVRPGQQMSFSLLAGRSSVERDDPAPSALSDGTNRASVLNLGWRSTRGSRLVLSQRAYLVTHEFLNKNQTGQRVGRGTNGELSYRADVARSLFGGVLEAGGQVQRIRGSRHVARYDEPAGGGLPRLESVDGFEGSSWLRSGYAHFQWAATPRLTLAPGFRLTDSTLVGRRTAAQWILGELSLRPGWTLNAAVGVSHQFPDLEHGLDWAGVPNLRPERATDAEIGIGQRVSESVRWEATFFARAERDVLREPHTYPRLVGGVITDSPNPGSYENALRGSSRGVELLLERRSETRLSGWVAYSYGTTRYADAARNETFWADFDQRHAINASGVYRLSDRTSFAVRFRGGSNFPIPGYLVARDGGLFVGSQRNDVRLPNYARLDVRGDRTLTYAGRRLTLFVEVLNVLNRTNLGLANGLIRPLTGEAAGFTEELFPRLATGGLRIEF